MIVGLGVGVGRQRFGGGIFSAYAARVAADGGVTEAGSCVDAVSTLLQSASLLLVPSGYKSGKVYSEIPTNGNGDLTWTRGSDAFRTNASGLIQRVPWNLLRFSEEFTNGVWGKVTGGSATLVVTANQTTAPNGTNTADLISITRSATTEISALYTLTNSGVGTFKNSIWLKAKDSSNVGKTIDLWSWEGATRGYTKITLTADWVRYEQNTTVFTGTGAELFDFGLLPISFSTSTTLAVEFYAWGAQSNEGTTAQTYLPTTDRLGFPRLDYTYGSCPAVLLEPQRTNLSLWSEDFSQSTWAKSNATVTTNTTTSPDGTTNADKLIASATTSTHLLIQSPAGSVNGTTVTFSIFAKSSELSRIQFVNNAGGSGSADYNLSAGTVNFASGVSASIVNSGNGWYRCILSYTPTTTGNFNIQIRLLDNSGNTTFTGNGTDGLFIYGAQLEAGAYASTYIQTTTASVTRIADSFTRNNIYTNNLISASGGTWFVELRNNVAYVRDGFGALYFGTQQITTSTLGDGFYIRRTNSSNARLSLELYILGVATTLYLTPSDNVKIAYKWNGTTLDVFVNGVKVVTASSFTATQLEFIGHTTNVDVPKFIQAMALFNTPLSDTQCASLTTL